MQNKLNCILLIGDDETVDFNHNQVLVKSDWPYSAAITQNGKEAIELLTT